jgi:hypothetical protein
MVENTVETYEILGGYNHLRPSTSNFGGGRPPLSPRSLRP